MTMHIGHFALRVVDLESAIGYFQQTLALRLVSRDDHEAMLSANEKHHELQLLSAATGGLDHIGLEVESAAELEAVRERAEAAGARFIDIPVAEAGLGETIRFEGPGELVYEVYVEMERGPLEQAVFLRPGVRRFGHLTFFSAEHAEILQFWIDVLGVRISDEFEGIAWTRCDTDHHALAVGPAPSGTVLHHHAWEVQDVAALSQYCDGMAETGRALIWGPVRHGPGFNISSYAEDPNGAVTEVYTDLLQIVDEQTYEPVDWSSTPRALNVWGPPPGEDFFAAGTPPRGAAPVPAA